MGDRISTNVEADIASQPIIKTAIAQRAIAVVRKRSLLVFVRNDGSAVRHDGDGVVFLAFVFHFLFSELPCFLDGSDWDLVGLSDGFEVLRLGDQDDGVLVGHAEEVECDEERGW